MWIQKIGAHSKNSFLWKIIILLLIIDNKLFRLNLQSKIPINSVKLIRENKIKVQVRARTTEFMLFCIPSVVRKWNIYSTVFHIAADISVERKEYIRKPSLEN